MIDWIPGDVVYLICMVEVNGAIGYMSKDMVSATKIPIGGNSGGEWTPPVL